MILSKCLLAQNTRVEYTYTVLVCMRRVLLKGQGGKKKKRKKNERLSTARVPLASVITLVICTPHGSVTILRTYKYLYSCMAYMCTYVYIYVFVRITPEVSSCVRLANVQFPDW